MEFTGLTTFIKSYIDACLLAIVEAGNSRKLSPDGLTEFERNYMANLSGDDVIKQGVVRQLVQFINQTLITDDSIWKKLDGITVAENVANKIEVLNSPKLGGELAEIWAKKSDVSLAISELIGGAPAALDVLNELAAAINNDANFSTTIVNLIGTKLAASAYTAEDVFNKVKSLDVDEGGLNASTLQGLNANQFSRLHDLIITNDFNHTVIGIGVVDNTNTSLNSTCKGSIVLVRSNGSYPLVVIEYNGSKVYDRSYARMAYTVKGYSSELQIIPVTFTFNAIKYFGFKIISEQSRAFKLISEYSSSVNPFAVEYYRYNSSTILNSEIYNSVAEDNVVDNSLKYNGYDVYHAANPQPETNKVKSTVDDTAGYLGEKLGLGVTLDANKKITFDLAKVAKADKPNTLRINIPFNVIKNRELDNSLSPVDYPGYGRSVSTPILVAGISGNSITVTGLPRYDLLQRSIFDGTIGVNKWALVNLDSHNTPTNDQPNGAYEVQSAIRAIAFTGANSADLTVTSAAGFTNGHRLMLISVSNERFKINPNSIDGLDINSEAWRTRQSQCCYPYRTQSGKWNVIMLGAPDANTFTYKLMESDSLYGPWTRSAINATNLLNTVGSNFVDLTAAIPQACKMFVAYGTKIPSSPYMAYIGWGADSITGSYSWSFPLNFKIYFLVCDETYSDIRAIEVKTNYKVKRPTGGFLHYPSLGYYKGKYYFSAIDDYPTGAWTDENRWDRHVFVSDTLDGVFEYHSTIQWGRNLNQGCFYSNHPVNGYVFGYGDALYAYVSGTSRYPLSGNKGDAVTGFFMFDDKTGSWNEFPSNFIPVPYGGDEVWGAGYEYMRDHSGGPGLIAMEDNKMFFFQGYTNGSDNYRLALIEIPL